MLFILNSAPGVGKTTLLKLLQEKLTSDFSFLDGDDVGRVNPMKNTTEWLNMIQDNMVSCCFNFRLYGTSNIILSFVFPSDERIGRLQNALINVGFDVCHIKLYCDDIEIEKRIKERNTSKLISISKAVELNGKIRNLISDYSLNTTNLNKNEVANDVFNYISDILSGVR